MPKAIFPYPILDEELKVSIESPTAVILWDDQIIPEALSGNSFVEEDSSMHPWRNQRPEWSSIRFTVNVKVPDRAVELMSNPAVVAIVKCRATHTRQAFRLMQQSESIWSAEITLTKEQYRGKAELICILSDRATNITHRFIGESPMWRIYFDEGELPPIGGSFEVRWVDFGSDDKFPHLKEYINEVYYLDITQPAPVVYLNKGFDLLPELFPETSKPTGSTLSVHEPVRTSIAKSVWLSLFQASLAAIRTDTRPEEADWPDIEWQRAVLTRILPRIYENLDAEAALSRASIDLMSRDIRYLESKALAVINKSIVREGQSLRISLREIKGQMRSR